MRKKDETVDDDAEGDIADSPMLSALHNDMTRVEKHVDNQLMVVLVLLVPSAYLYERSSFRSGWLDIVCVVIVFGTIVIALLRNIRKKRSIAEKYGLGGGISLAALFALLTGAWIWVFPETKGKKIEI